MKRQQLPGRIEALRLVLRSGISNAPAHLLRIAGMGKTKRPCPPGPTLRSVQFDSGPSGLSVEAEAALPF
jgi:hypothetical protein